ncbi:hypothetical protein C8D88_11115 [Lentzea atacamensis]|uniref:Uncharacterized protein n=1 Tax=Lentzea atacamensis TaxID=531938 RepID=A0A316HXX9_9PSEU|nr:hypothetical protein [Lentzea atacamensis]PWK83134.1 hypothetical protein C8D88_11115 [Lentzea atacamensis]
MTSPWVAVITGSAAILAALIALIGVHYGQWLQSQREREDRVEQWQREDRHRFADHKREIYAEFLILMSRWHTHVGEVAYIADLELPADPEQADPYGWAQSKGFSTIEEQGDPVRKALMRVRLVAPHEVWSTGAKIVGLIANACEKILYEAEVLQAQEYLDEVDFLHNKIAEMMHEDLTA